MANLLAADKRPGAKAEQAEWVKKRNAAVAAVKRQFKGHETTSTAQDEVRAKQLELTRQRVEQMTATAHARLK